MPTSGDSSGPVVCKPFVVESIFQTDVLHQRPLDTEQGKLLRLTEWEEASPEPHTQRAGITPVPRCGPNVYRAAESQPPPGPALPVLTRPSLTRQPTCEGHLEASMTPVPASRGLVFSPSDSLPQFMVVTPTCWPGLPPELGVSSPWFPGLGWMWARGICCLPSYSFSCLCSSCS